MSDAKLKPCPFCDGEVISRLNSPSSDITPEPWAFCLGCGVGIPIDKWNRRTPSLEDMAGKNDEIKTLQAEMDKVHQIALDYARERDEARATLSDYKAQLCRPDQCERVKRMETELAKVREENEDTCKWSKTGMYFYEPSCNRNNPFPKRQSTWAFCPYCGKRIEEVKS